ncbi:MAG: ABC transporter ATP-binding protein [Bdellovibrionota bacterium]
MENVNLSVVPGELVVLLGPSGCGKSTLLRIVAGLETPSQGQVWIDGMDCTTTVPSQRGIGFVFQDYALYPHMSVRENLEFSLHAMKIHRTNKDRRIRNAVEILELGPTLSRKPGQLSGGQRQRVAIGRALVKEPKLLLLDEPLSNLDAQLRLQTRGEIAALHRRIRATTLYVTHDQEEAMTLADRIVVLKDGRIRQIGAPLEIYHRPADRFVASFVGMMNFLEPLQGERVLGFRPEACRVMEKGKEEKGDFNLKVEVVENLGYETRVSGRVGSNKILIRTNRSVRIDDRLSIHVDRAHVSWFECGPEGRRIHSPEGEAAGSFIAQSGL